MFHYLGQFLLLCSWLIGISARAEIRTYLDLGEPVLGFDTEVDWRLLQWAVPLFDLDFLDRSVRQHQWEDAVLKADVLEDYVLSRAAFENLPLQAQQELSQGLDLNSSVRLHMPPKDHLILPTQSSSVESRETAPLQLPLSLLSASTMRRHHLRLAAETPQLLSQPISPDERVRSDWALLNRRWNLWPIDRRQALVHLAHMSTDKVAKAILRLPVPPKDPVLMDYLRLNAGAPDWFSQHVVWTLDGRVPDPGDAMSRGKSSYFEFAFRGTTQDRHLITSVTSSLFQLLRAEHLVGRVDTTRTVDVSHHWHVSYPKIEPSYLRDHHWTFETRLKQYKLLILVRILSGGPQNDGVLINFNHYNNEKSIAQIVLQHTYDTPIRQRNVISNLFDPMLDKGFLRLLQDHYAELREPTQHPNADLDEFVELMRIQHTKTYQAAIASRIAPVLARNPDILGRIAKLNPKIIGDFKGLLDHQILVTSLSRSLELTRRGTTEYGALFAALTKQGSTLPVAKALAAIARRRERLLGWNMYYDILANAQVKQFFRATFLNEPELYEEYPYELITIDDLLKLWPSQSDNWKQIVLAHLLGHLCNTRYSYSDTSGLLRQTLEEIEPKNPLAYWAQFALLLLNIKEGHVRLDADATDEFPAPSIDNIQSAIWIMIYSSDETSLDWLFNFWTYLVHNTKDFSSEGRQPQSAYRFVAKRVEITHPQFYAKFRQRIQSDRAYPTDVRTITDMLAHVAEAGPTAQARVNELLTELKSIKPHLWAEVEREACAEALRSDTVGYSSEL